MAGAASAAPFAPAPWKGAVPDVDAAHARGARSAAAAACAALMIASLAFVTSESFDKALVAVGAKQPPKDGDLPQHVDPFQVDAGNWERRKEDDAGIMAGRRFKVGDKDITADDFKQGEHLERASDFGRDLIARTARTEERFKPLRENGAIKPGPDAKTLAAVAITHRTGYKCPQTWGRWCAGASGRHQRKAIRAKDLIYCKYDKKGAFQGLTECGVRYPDPWIGCGLSNPQAIAKVGIVRPTRRMLRRASS